MKKQILWSVVSLFILGYSCPSFALNARMDRENDDNLNEMESCLDDGFGNRDCGFHGGGGGGGGTVTPGGTTPHSTKLCLDAGPMTVDPVRSVCDAMYIPSPPTGCSFVTCSSNCWYCGGCIQGYTYDSSKGTCSRNEEPELPDISDPPCPNAPKFYSTNSACMAECSHELCHRCKSTGAHPITQYYCNDGSALCRVAHCAICSVSSAYECELCSSGYVLDGGLCVDEPVNPGCEDAFCLKCKAGYKRVNNDCVPCEPGTYQEESNFTGSSCKPCQNGATTKEYATTYCPMCMIVYPLDHYGMCTQCDENICKAGVCQGEEGTVWDDTVHNCVPVVCSSHCTACTSSASCTTCEEGYVLQGGSCVKAQARCQDPYVVSDDGCCCVKQEIVNRERP